MPTFPGAYGAQEKYPDHFLWTGNLPVQSPKLHASYRGGADDGGAAAAAGSGATSAESSEYNKWTGNIPVLSKELQVRGRLRQHPVTVTISSVFSCPVRSLTPYSHAGYAAGVSGQELPHGWVELIDPFSQVAFYWHTTSCVRRNTRPTEAMPTPSGGSNAAHALDFMSSPVLHAPAPAGAKSSRFLPGGKNGAGGELPEGWREEFDPASNRNYWFNENTGESVWTKPTVGTGDGDTRGDWTAIKVQPSSRVDVLRVVIPCMLA